MGESITNLRVATFLAMATTIGAVTGALLSGVVDPRVLFTLFGLVLAFSGLQMLRSRGAAPNPSVGPDLAHVSAMRATEPALGDESAKRKDRIAGRLASTRRTTTRPRKHKCPT